VNRICISITRGFDDFLNDEIRLRSRTAPKGERMISQGDMHGIAVWLGIDRHALESGITTGPNDPDCNFATVGNEHSAHEGDSL
jgi:hypothetical protein